MNHLFINIVMLVRSRVNLNMLIVSTLFCVDHCHLTRGWVLAAKQLPLASLLASARTIRVRTKPKIPIFMFVSTTDSVLNE